jgi:hypothetical protein
VNYESYSNETVHMFSLPKKVLKGHRFKLDEDYKVVVVQPIPTLSSITIPKCVSFEPSYI